MRSRSITVENLPDLNPPAFGEVSDASRPILSFAWESPRAHRVAAHRHPRGHIIFPNPGTFWVTTPEGTWLVASRQAIWIPPHVHHAVHSRGPVAARMLFVDPAHAARLPSRSGTVTVSPLLAELLARAVDYGNDYPPGGPAARLAQVVLDELAVMEPVPLLLPVSREARLARAMDRLIERPASPEGIEWLAREAGASPRTLARLFRKETGMSFQEWRTRLRLVESIERLTHGATVTEVALELGYGSTSSFAFMFRSHLGVSPGRYRTGDDGSD